MYAGTFNFNDNYVTGIEAMVMTSEDAANRMIDLFKQAISVGLHPHMVESEIYSKINPDLLLEHDKRKVQQEVSDFWEANKERYA